MTRRAGFRWSPGAGSTRRRGVKLSSTPRRPAPTPPGCDALLQQADAGGAVPALQGAGRRHRHPDLHLQHSRPARSRASPARAPSPTFTSRSAPAPTSRSSAGSSTTCSNNEQATSTTTSSPTPTARSSARTSGTPRISTVSSRASTRTRGTYDTRRGSTKALRSSRRRTARPGVRRPDRRRPGGAGAPRGESHGSGGASIGDAEPHRDETMQHPRCAFQVLKRHFARYTPEMVEEICGIPQDLFLRVCEPHHRQLRSRPHHRVRATRSAGPSTPSACSTSGPRRSSRRCSATSAGPAAASSLCAGTRRIQGSTDIPTLFNLLPGYIPMPHAHAGRGPRHVHRGRGGGEGLLGQHARLHRQPAQGVLRRRGHGRQRLLLRLPAPAHREPQHLRDRRRPDRRHLHGLLPHGREPRSRLGQRQDAAARHGEPRLARGPRLLADRERHVVEGRPRDRDRASCAPRTSAPRCSSSRPPRTPRRTAASRTPSACCSGTTPAVEPAGDARSELWFMYHLGRQHPREARGVRPIAMDRPILDLTWDYPTEGPSAEPVAEAVLAEINGWDADGQPLSSYTELKDDGSHRVRLLDLLRRRSRTASTRRRGASPAASRTGSAPEWGWAWPANRRILYNRASADPDGVPWSERKALRLVGRGAGESGRATTCPTSRPTYRPTTCRRPDATGPEALGGRDPFIMQADGKALAVRAGRAHRRPAADALRAAGLAVPQPAVRAAAQPGAPDDRRATEINRYHPSGDEPRRDVFPYVATTYRLTEHYTAGRDVPLAALPVRAAAGDVLRGLPRARRRARARARRLGDDRHRAQRDRGAGARHRAHAAAEVRRPARAPDRPAVPLGPERATPPATPPTS